jgi:hypothetical protein
MNEQEIKDHKEQLKLMPQKERNEWWRSCDQETRGLFFCHYHDLKDRSDDMLRLWKLLQDGEQYDLLKLFISTISFKDKHKLQPCGTRIDKIKHEWTRLKITDPTK